MSDVRTVVTLGTATPGGFTFYVRQWRKRSTSRPALE